MLNLAGVIQGHQNKEKEIRESAQPLKALAALLEHPGSVPSITRGSLQLPVTLVLGYPVPSSGLSRYCMRVVRIQTGGHLTHTQE